MRAFHTIAPTGLLGHSSRSVASRYRHLLPAQMEADCKILDAYVDGTRAGKVVPLAVAQ